MLVSSGKHIHVPAIYTPLNPTFIIIEELGYAGVYMYRSTSLLVLGIGRVNHYRLSEHISRLIIDCTIEMYVPLTLTSEVIKNAQYLTM